MSARVAWRRMMHMDSWPHGPPQHDAGHAGRHCTRSVHFICWELPEWHMPAYGPASSLKGSIWGSSSLAPVAAGRRACAAPSAPAMCCAAWSGDQAVLCALRVQEPAPARRCRATRAFEPFFIRSLSHCRHIVGCRLGLFWLLRQGCAFDAYIMRFRQLENVAPTVCRVSRWAADWRQ